MNHACRPKYVPFISSHTIVFEIEKLTRLPHTVHDLRSTLFLLLIKSTQLERFNLEKNLLFHVRAALLSNLYSNFALDKIHLNIVFPIQTLTKSNHSQHVNPISATSGASNALALTVPFHRHKSLLPTPVSPSSQLYAKPSWILANRASKPELRPRKSRSNLSNCTKRNSCMVQWLRATCLLLLDFVSGGTGNGRESLRNWRLAIGWFGRKAEGREIWKF